MPVTLVQTTPRYLSLPRSVIELPMTGPLPQTSQTRAMTISSEPTEQQISRIIANRKVYREYGRTQGYCDGSRGDCKRDALCYNGRFKESKEKTYAVQPTWK